MDVPPRLIGQSPQIRNVEADIDCAASSDVTVLITGERGVGKEIVARLVHHRGRRCAKPLISLNCAGIPDTRLACELFGHVRGSFTDAHRDARGLLEAADNGTIFLDEVGEISLRVQSLLLHFLAAGAIQCVGSRQKPTQVDVRVITATNRILVERVRAREFREDLLYRLNIIHIAVPPVRERREDIPLLLEHFLHESSSDHGVMPPQLTAETLDLVRSYDWPENVRQIKNVAERLVVRSAGKAVVKDQLPREILA